MSWSPFREDVIQDPANGHQELLQACPVHHYDAFDPPFYTLSRYEDVENALRDIDTFSSHHGQGPRFTEPLGMLCDPPQHTYVRRLVQKAFTPGAMRELAPRIKAVTETLIEQIKDRDTFDFHDDFAFPLPVIIIAGMLGVPEQDLERFKHWSDVQVAAMGSEDPSEYEADQVEFFGYMQNHLTRRKSDLAKGQVVPDDLLTLIADGKDDQGNLLPEADAQSVLMQLLVGGNETTTSLITNMMWRLLQNDQWRLLIQQPELVEDAVEESLRFDPPVLGLYRTTTRDVEMHDVVIPKNAKVYINYAAANRDQNVFNDPDRFDITRERRRHMAFGLGTHFCLGAPMARLETEIAFKTLIGVLPNLSLISEGERIAPFFLWGRRKLPVAAN